MIDRKLQPVRPQRTIEVVKDDAGFNHATPAGGIELDQLVEMARAVDHQRPLTV